MADMGVGEAAAAEGAKSAGEAAAATTAADVGAGTIADTAALESGIAAGQAGEIGAGGALGSAGAADAAGALMPAAVPELTSPADIAAANAGLPNPVTEGLAGTSGAAVGAGAGAPAGSDVAPSGGTAPSVAPGASAPSFINASTPLTPLTPDTASALGITPFDLGAEGSATAAGFVPGGADAGIGTNFGMSAGETGAFDMGQFAPQDVGLTPSSGFGPSDALTLKSVTDNLKKLGLSPATAAMLGISGAQALSKQKPTPAEKTLSTVNTPVAQQSAAVIQSGGTASPAWATQKASIDATIDQQIREQAAAIIQNAQNSGVGADSQVTIQQVNKLKDQLETQRQQLYAQAQQQNVQAAVATLTGSNQALASVASTQLAEDARARQAAGNTAQTALMLQALQKQQTPTATATP